MYSKEAVAFCRTDQIMADAAYALLTKNSRTRTGEFLYDEDILKQEGITDYDQYLVSPEALKTENVSPSLHIGSVSEVFEKVHSLCNEELVQSINGIFEFHLSGKEPGVWYLDLKNNSGNAGRGSFHGHPGCTMILDSEDFVKMFQGQLNPLQAFMGGKMEVKGDKMLAAKLEKLMGTMKSKL